MPNKDLIVLALAGAGLWWASKQKGCSSCSGASALPPGPVDGQVSVQPIRPMCLLVNPIAGNGSIMSNLGMPGVHIPGNNFGQTVIVPPGTMVPQTGSFWPANHTYG